MVSKSSGTTTLSKALKVKGVILSTFCIASSILMPRSRSWRMKVARGTIALDQDS
jgi:hypothetical protein